MFVAVEPTIFAKVIVWGQRRRTEDSLSAWTEVLSAVLTEFSSGKTLARASSTRVCGGIRALSCFRPGRSWPSPCMAKAVPYLWHWWQNGLL